MTMRLWISLASLALTAVTASASLASPGDAQAGKTVYDSKCKTCHGADGKGNATLAKTLNVTFKDLGSKEILSKSDDDLKKNITEGIGKMQPVKGLTDKQASDLIAFLRDVQGDAKAGKVVYDSKCKLCHGADGKGNAALAKTLMVTFKDLGSKEILSKSDDELKKNITEGTGKMQPVKGLTDKQASDLIAFLRDVQGDAKAGKVVYDSKCKLCHGADGKGNPILAKSLNVTFPDMTSPDVLKGKSDAEVKKGIVEGYNKMKPVKGLSDKQLDDVIAFVRSLAKF